MTENIGAEVQGRQKREEVLGSAVPVELCDANPNQSVIQVQHKLLLKAVLYPLTYTMAHHIRDSSATQAVTLCHRAFSLLQACDVTLTSIASKQPIN